MTQSQNPSQTSAPPPSSFPMTNAFYSGSQGQPIPQSSVSHPQPPPTQQPPSTQQPFPVQPQQPPMSQQSTSILNTNISVINASPNLNDTLANMTSVMKGQQEWQSQAIDILNTLASKQDNAVHSCISTNF